MKYIKKTEMWNINITYRGQTGILKKHKQFPYKNKVWPPDTPKKKKKLKSCVKPIGTKQTNWKNISKTHIKIRSDHREGQNKLAISFWVWSATWEEKLRLKMASIFGPDFSSAQLAGPPKVHKCSAQLAWPPHPPKKYVNAKIMLRERRKKTKMLFSVCSPCHDTKFRKNVENFTLRVASPESALRRL